MQKFTEVKIKIVKINEGSESMNNFDLNCFWRELFRDKREANRLIKKATRSVNRQIDYSQEEEILIGFLNF